MPGERPPRELDRPAEEAAAEPGGRAAGGRALEALVTPGETPPPRVSWIFLALCLAVTLPSLVFPSLYDLFGGVEPRRHPWQLVTAVFEHGWPGFPGIVHLGLNLFLIVEVGRPCERLLGSLRFLALGLAAVAAGAAAQLAAGGVNGSSLVIWAWGPPLAAALLHARRLGGTAGTPAHGRLLTPLVIMYGAVTVAMTVLPFAFGWRGNPLVALVRGNLFHLVATAVGLAATAVGWRWIGERVRRLAG